MMSTVTDTASDHEPSERGIFRGLTSYGDLGFSRFLRSAFLAGAGFDQVDLDRPVIGIADLRSDYNPCHSGLGPIIDQVRRGVLQAGGLPMVFPTASLGESFLTPTSMLFRNLLAMETEELVRAQPMDAAVLIGGCDKTVPAQLMAAAVSDVPVLVEVVGPMLTGRWEGERLGACTDCRRIWARHRAGDLTAAQIRAASGSLATTAGTCMVMGTASTMACLAETMGMMLPGGATPPSPTGDRLRHAVATGRRAVELAVRPVLPREILTADAFRNAATVLAAIGGSTNAIVHLLAIARRAGVDFHLAELEQVFSRTPLLVDLKPSGSNYMEDFHWAGGVPVLLSELCDVLSLDHVGCSGLSLRRLVEATVRPHDPAGVIRTMNDPIGPPGSLAVLTGSLAPEGAVIKPAAGTTKLLRHRGPALVFDSAEEAALRLNDPDLDVTPDHVMVLRNAGPVAAAMPEAGSLPIPVTLARQGVTDMVRVSDARMSGTSYGTVVLHISPEAATGGPLATVRDGDLIELDVPGRRIDLLVPPRALAQRARAHRSPPIPTRGWRRLYAETVMSAADGADLGFL